MKAQTLRKCADKIHSFSFKIRREPILYPGPYTRRERFLWLLGVKIQSISDKLDEIAYYKEQENK